MVVADVINAVKILRNVGGGEPYGTGAGGSDADAATRDQAGYYEPTYCRGAHLKALGDLRDRVRPECDVVAGDWFDGGGGHGAVVLSCGRLSWALPGVLVTG